MLLTVLGSLANKVFNVELRIIHKPCIATVLDELVHEKERYKSISEELDQTFQELSGY